MRSLIIRPKGFTIPEKKKEALKKGISFINSAIDRLKSLKINASNPSDKVLLEEAWRVKGQLYLECHRINSVADTNNTIPENPSNTGTVEINSSASQDNTLKEILGEAISAGCNKFGEKEEDVQFAISYCELMDSREYLKQVIESPLEGIEFEKARAYKLLGEEQKVRENIQVVIEQLSWFSDPLWEDTVGFIDKLRYEGKEYWKALALAIYKACKKQEAETESLHLRWYWSRQRYLYDLAFMAANAPEEKALIADSLKSRPSLRWSALEAMGKSENQIAEMFENEALAMLGGFVKGVRKNLKQRRKKSHKTEAYRSITDIPQGWIAIHFYVNRLENTCYALIYNKEENTWKCEFVKEYQKLFRAFLTWQINYSRSKEQAANQLVQVCEEIGKAMPFLFEKDIIPQGKDILFIPHDFLHRLPLHGAINKETNEVFLKNHPCCYLPAWSFAAKTNNPDINGRILLKNFSDYDYKDISGQQYWTSPVRDPVRDPASPDNLKTIDTPPELLVILCHGEADVTNPFNARLKLTGNGISHLEILQATGMNLKGSKIILGACETDLVPPLCDMLDEHLSIATAFLTNGAREILGTMWQARPEDIEEIVELLCNKKICDISNEENKLWNWQKECIRHYWAGADDMFYRGMAFRITGLTT